MIKTILILSLIFLFSFNIASAVAEYTNQPCSEDFSNMPPAFSLLIKNNKPIINPGDTVTLEIYITGYGSVKKPAKIFTVYPINFVDEKESHTSILTISTGGKNGIVPIEDMIHNKVTVNNTTAIIGIIPTYIFDHMVNTYTQCTLISIGGEGKNPPYEFLINTSKKAEPGDNELEFVLTYSDGERWYQDKEKISIHINNFLEQYQIYTWFFGIVGIVITTGIFKYLQKWLDKKKGKKIPIVPY